MSLVVMELKGLPNISSRGCGVVPSCLHPPALQCRGGWLEGPRLHPRVAQGTHQAATLAGRLDTKPLSVS